MHRRHSDVDEIILVGTDVEQEHLQKLFHHDEHGYRSVRVVGPFASVRGWRTGRVTVISMPNSAYGHACERWRHLRHDLKSTLKSDGVWVE